MLAPRVTLTEGLTDPTVGLIMGSTAEVLARDFGITRAEADRFALESHQRAKRARDSGRLTREIFPHLALGAKRTLEHDDGIRDDQSLEALAKLKPYFEKPDGVVTVGNSCGITDGATAMLVTTLGRARSLGLTPQCALRAWAFSGCDPARMGLGPVYSSARALAEAGCTLADMDVVEINEAFAVQVQACVKAFASDAFASRELGLDPRAGGDPAREAQSERRRDRAGPSGRRHGRAPAPDGRDRARRAREAPRADHAVHRRRPGRSVRDRADLVSGVRSSRAHPRLSLVLASLRASLLGDPQDRLAAPSAHRDLPLRVFSH
jgi:acetyl-CoA acetyltransferase